MLAPDTYNVIPQETLGANIHLSPHAGEKESLEIVAGSSKNTVLKPASWWK